MPRKHVNLGSAPAKAELLVKPCAACGRPFAWRKKWARDWPKVRFCSDACRAHRPSAPSSAEAPSAKNARPGAVDEG